MEVVSPPRVNEVLVFLRRMHLHAPMLAADIIERSVFPAVFHLFNVQIIMCRCRHDQGMINENASVCFAIVSKIHISCFTGAISFRCYGS